MEHTIFTDFDEFTATNSQLDGRWTIKGEKDWHWSTETLGVGQCHMLRCFTNTGLITEGIASADAYHFYITTGNSWRNFGSEFTANDILVMEPGVEYNATTSTAEGWHGILVPRHLLDEQLASRREPAQYGYILRTERQRTDAIFRVFSSYIAAVAKNPELEFSPAGRIMEAELRSLLEPVLLSDGGASFDSSSLRLSTLEVVHRSHTVMDQFANEPIHVSELARLVGVSIRSLQMAFNEHYQIGPSQYQRLRQLRRVRQDLRRADPDQDTVTDIAMRWGVWELGRFSGRYKLQFGELPRDTLRRAPPPGFSAA